MRKFEAIDLMDLYSKANSQTWNTFLTQCLKRHDIPKLVRVRYGLQAGMADLAKKKLNSEKMIQFFIRLDRSIEKTIKSIAREKNPNPCDDPLLAPHHLELKDQKNARDHELELFLRRSGY